MFGDVAAHLARAATDAAMIVGTPVTVSVCGCESYQAYGIPESTAVEVETQDGPRIMTRNWRLTIPEAQLCGKCRPADGTIIVLHGMKFEVAGDAHSNGYELVMRLRAADCEATELVDVY